MSCKDSVMVAVKNCADVFLGDTEHKCQFMAFVITQSEQEPIYYHIVFTVSFKCSPSVVFVWADILRQYICRYLQNQHS